MMIDGQYLFGREKRVVRRVVRDVGDTVRKEEGQQVLECVSHFVCVTKRILSCSETSVLALSLCLSLQTLVAEAPKKTHVHAFAL